MAKAVSANVARATATATVCVAPRVYALAWMGTRAMGARTRTVPETVRMASNVVDMDCVTMVTATALDSITRLSQLSVDGLAAIATRKHAQVENMRGTKSFQVHAVVTVRAARTMVLPTANAPARKDTLVLAAK